MLYKANGIAIKTLGLGLLALGCSSDDAAEPGASFKLTSPALSDGQAVPADYTCVGKNFPFSGMPPVDHTSPELNWTAGPAGTQSYAIVFRDVTLTTGAASGREYVSTRNFPSGEICTSCVPLSGVSGTSFRPSRPIR